MTFSGTSRRRALKLGLAASLAAPAFARAQAWPSGPIVFLNPFPAGGGTDTFCRPLATPQRMTEFPDIPTSAEIGVPNWIVSTWYGLWAIKGTPQPIVERMYLEVAKALRVDKMQAIWKDKAAEAGGETPDQFAERIRAEIEKWQKVVAAADVRID